MRKLSRVEILNQLPLSSHSLSRISKNDSKFPALEIIGRSHYIDRAEYLEWLNSRVTRNSEPVSAGAIRPTDKVCDTSSVCELLGRSGAWVWANVTKNPELAIVNLSPGGNSQNPRRYFIEREIVEAFPALVELAVQREAA